MHNAENTDKSSMKPDSKSEHAQILVQRSMSVRKQLLTEADAMSRFVLNNGISIPSSVIRDLDQIKQQLHYAPGDKDSPLGALDTETVQKLVSVHQALARASAPATPRTLKFLADEQDRRSILFFLGPVPLIRYLSLLSAFFVLAMIISSLSNQVNSTTINQGFLDSANQVLLLNQLFLLSCAGLGAGFANLFQASSYVARNTYDMKYDSTYWSRIIMGLMSGLILAELVPRTLYENSATFASFGKPALAMLGGFSVSLVYRILRRLVSTMESLFKGEPDNKHYQEAWSRAEASSRETQQQLGMVNRLVELKDMVDAGADKSELNEKLSRHLKEQVSHHGE